MFKDEYRNELNKLTTSEKFRQNTVSLMQEKQAELVKNNKKVIQFSTNITLKAVASFAVLVLTLGAYILAHSDFAISTDMAETESSAQNQSAVQESDIDQKNNDMDILPYDATANKSAMRVYTVNDAADIQTGHTQGNPEIVFSNDGGGGMGYESYLHYAGDYIADNIYTTDMNISEMAVYQYNYLTYDQMHSELDRALSNLNITRDDLLEVECFWVQTGDTVSGNKTIFSFDKPSVGGILQSIRTDFDGGTILIDRGGTVDITISTDVPEYSSNRQYAQWVLNQYSGFIGENCRVYSWYDRTYQGEENYHNQFYPLTDDFSSSLLNSTVMDYYIAHVSDVEYETGKPGEGIIIFYYADGTYTDYATLPVINYSQALWQLYNGRYYTSVPYTINDNSVVVKIDMVYKEPARNYQTMVKEGLAVPFYKIYVECENLYGDSAQIETENGVLKNYGAYYVCAIHPDYIELTDNYIHFNGG